MLAKSGSLAQVCVLAIFLAASLYFNITLTTTAKRIRAARAQRLREQSRYSASRVDEAAYSTYTVRVARSPASRSALQAGSATTSRGNYPSTRAPYRPSSKRACGSR